MSTLVRLAVALAVVAGSSLSSAGAAPGFRPFCDAFGTDGRTQGTILFCVGRDIPSPATGPIGVGFFASADAGRTWAKRAAVGLTFNLGSDWRQVLHLPDSTVGRLLVQDRVQGLFESTDGGESFRLVDPLATAATTYSTLTALSRPLPLAGEDLPGPVASVVETNYGYSWALGPPTRRLVPGPASATEPLQFLELPSSGGARRVAALAETRPPGGLAADARVEIFGCDAAMLCTQPIASFPVGYRLLQGHVSEGSRAAVIWLARNVGGQGPALLHFVSTDGSNFTRLTGAEELLAKAGREGLTRSSMTVDHRGNFVLLIASSGTQALWLSKDAGRSWKLRSRASETRGSLPLTSSAATNSHRVWGTAGGRLLTAGLNRDTGRTNDLFCSRDLGATWTATC